MFTKSFDKIMLADLEDLISSGASERHNLEFKKEVWKRDDEEIREMLRDISSMANAYGGYFVIGMDEEPETGKALSLVSVANAEDERDRIMGSCLANLQPRLRGLDIKTIEITPGQAVLLIKVPAGFDLHQIIFKGLYQFWMRHDRQKSRMTYEEIKDSILRNRSSTEDSKKLIQNRRQEISDFGPIMFLSAAPIKLESELFKISNSRIRDLLKNSRERYGGWNFDFRHGHTRPTINGLGINEGPRTLELYRSGYIEASVVMQEPYTFKTRETHEGQEKILHNFGIVEFTYTFFKKLKLIADEIGYDAPYLVGLSLYNMESFWFYQYREGAYGHSERMPARKAEIGPLIFEAIEPTAMAKELCDRLWQAYGFEHEPYHQNGAFKFE